MLGALLAAAVQAAAVTPEDTLAMAQARVAQALRQPPRLACTALVNRTYRRDERQRTSARSCDDVVADRASGRLRPRRVASERIRLRVALSTEGHEVYSWSDGAGQTSDGRALVGGGPFGTGAFGSFLADIFIHGGATIEHLESAMANGRRLSVYRFLVPAAESRYFLNAPGGVRRPMAYSGSMWIEEATGELARIQLRTAAIDDATAECEATTTIDYAGGLTPRGSRLQLLSRVGEESEVAIDYTDCGGSVAAPVIALAQRVPAGFTMELALVGALTSDGHAAGDRVSARVVKKVVDKQTKETVLPAGALLGGRIVRFEMQHGEKPQLVFAIDWESVSIDGVDRGIGAKASTPKGRFALHTAMPATGVVVVPALAGPVVVPSGFVSTWTTQ